MQPKTHIIIGIVSVILIHFIFPQFTFLQLSIILFSSVLIDFDHYLYYIFQTRNFNLKKCYQWYRKHLLETLALPMEKRKKIYTGFYIFHGIEPLIILFVLGINIHPLFFFVFVGGLFHLALDIPSEIIIKGTFQKISLIYNYSQWKKLQN